MKFERSMTIPENKIVSADTKVDELYKFLKTMPQAEMPLTHIFTEGLYCRQILMPRNTCVISRIHKFEHPFVISSGSILVWSADGSRQLLKAPYMGVTQPGQQRVLYALTDTIWTTFHVTDLTDPDQIVEEVTMPPDEGSVTIKDLAMKQLTGALPPNKEVNSN